MPKPRFEYVSAAVTAITGYTPDDFYADPNFALRIIDPADRRRLAGSRRATADPPEVFVVRVIKPDNSTVALELQNAAVRNTAGALVAVEGIARDVTARASRRGAARTRDQG